MALKPELKSWLDQVGPKLSENVRTILAGELERDEVATVWRDTVMARSDYSRAQDELRRDGERLKAEADLKAREAEALLAANQKWRADNSEAYEQALKAKELADAELAAHRARIQALAEQGLIDPNDPTLAATKRANGGADPAKGTNGTSKHLSQEELDALLAKKEAAMATSFADAFTYFEDLADEHLALTGQRLKRTELLAELKKNPNANLQQVWEQKYDIPKIRAELAAKAEQEKIDKAVAEAIAKDRSERAVDAHSFRPRDLDSDSENKHILSLFPDQNNNASRLSDGVRAAKASWEKGEFRVPSLQKPV